MSALPDYLAKVRALQLEAREAAPPPPPAPRWRQEVNESLASRGWALLESKSLGDEVLILLGDEVEIPVEITTRDPIRYTVSELRALAGVTPEILREIHSAKVALRRGGIEVDVEKVENEKETR